MKTKNREYSLLRNKLMKTTMFTTAIFVAFLFIGSSVAASITANETMTENNIQTFSLETPSFGLAPKNEQVSVFSNPQNGRGETIFAQDCTNGNFVWFDSDTPGTYNIIAPTGFTAFPQGACYVEDVQWTTDTNGNIYTIDEYTGTMTFIGNAGVTDGLVALSYDPSSGTLFGGSITALYEIDQGTGAATLIGSYGSIPGSGWLISLDCDNDGNMYGYNIDNTASAILFSVDTGTGAATQIGPIGFTANYGQDLVYDKDNDVLYACAYNIAGTGAEFWSIDTGTGAGTFLGSLAGGAQTTCAAMHYISSATPPEHDLSLKTIVKPSSGTAGVITPTVTIQNRGNNSEFGIPVDMVITKKNVSQIFYEDFDGTWGTYGDNPPAGWNITDEGDEATPTWNTNDWYNYYDSTWLSNCARVYYSPTENQLENLTTPPIDCSGITGTTFSFNNYYQDWDYLDFGYILGSTDNGTTWPILIDTYDVDMARGVQTYDISSWADGQSQVKIRFMYVGNYGWYWHIDDFTVFTQTWDSEYDQTIYIDIPTLTENDFTFPAWTPSDLNVNENVDIEYFVEAEINFSDNNTANNYKSKGFTLHYGPFHDIGITEIVSPVEGPAQPSFTPEIVIENFGQNAENVNVNFKIQKFVGTSTVYTEGFESMTIGGRGFPPGWTVIQTDPTSTWYSTGTYARCQESGATGAQDEWLLTTVYDCSALTEIYLDIGYVYMATPDGEDFLQIWGSTNGGTSWDYMVENISAYTSGAKQYDLSSWAAGQSQVRIAFRWLSGAAMTSDYFYMRTVKISQPAMLQSGISEDFESAWGPYGDNPPAGWNISDYGSEYPPVWNNNDWHKYYYSTFASNTARVYYSPYESMDEWLITPTLDCSAMTSVSLNFRQYFYFYSTYPGYGIIDGSIDNGTTWTVNIANYSVTQSSGYYGFDLTSWAAGQSQVQLRFRYWAPGAQGRYWYIDDVLFGYVADAVILFENYYFDDVYDDVWPTGWTQEDVVNMESGTDPNIWRGMKAGYATTPTGVVPYGGTQCAIYDTGLLYPHGSMSRLQGPAINFASYSASIINLKFMMYQSSYSSSYTDHVWVQVSTDNATWTNITQIMAYDPTNPGWVEQTVDLSAYASEPAVYLGFFGVDGGYIDIIIDDITIEVPTPVVEFDQTINLNIASGEVINLAYVDWIPSDWLVVENTSVEYLVKTSAPLAGDANPADNIISEYMDLVYPYFHDMSTTDILSPTSGIGGSSYTPEIVIKNEGQNDETGGTANVKIERIEIVDAFTQKIYSGTGQWTQSAYGSHSYEPLGTGDFYANCWDTGSATQFDVGLFTVPFDFTGMTSVELTFQRNFQDYAGYGQGAVNTYSGDTDTFEEELLYMTTDDPSTGVYTVLTFDPSIYTDPSEVYIEFWYTDDQYTSTAWGFSIDDLTITAVGYVEGFEGIFPPGSYNYITEYDEDVIVTDTIGYLESANVIFPAWVPDHYTNEQSGLVAYNIVASVDYTGDSDASNDEIAGTFTLDYFHDVGAIEITKPEGDGEPGTYEIEGIVENFGTFDEDYFAVSAAVWQIGAKDKSDILVYYDEKNVVDLEIGDQKTVAFADWTVSDEGEYRVEIETQLMSDVNGANNLVTKRIIIDIPDTTPPVTTIDVDGVEGDNGYFISDVTITLTATDDDSGVKETYYRINGGDWVLYTSPVTFGDDGDDHMVEAYSVDNEDNTEDPKDEEFSIDQTPPTVSLTWEEETFTIIADASDETSGIAKVAFYINDVYVGEDTTAPYEYVYEDAGKDDTAQAIAYDRAGNEALSESITPYAQPQGQSNPTLEVQQITQQKI